MIKIKIGCNFPQGYFPRIRLFEFVTLKRGFNVKYMPYAFTEQGVVMLSSVLNSERAIEISIAIMRAFVKIRELSLGMRGVADKLRRYY